MKLPKTFPRFCHSYRSINARMSIKRVPLTTETVKESDFKLKVVHQSDNFLVIDKNFDLVLNDNDPLRFSLAKETFIKGVTQSCSV